MTKERIIKTLLTMASEKGLGAVSLSQLAKACDITKAALYHHFPSRDALVGELFSYCKGLAQKQMGTIELGGSALEVLSDAMDHWHELYSEEPMRSFYRIIESEALFNKDAHTIRTSLSEMLTAQSTVLLETLSLTGRLAIGDLDLAVQTFSATVHRLLQRLLSEDEASIAWEEEQFIERFVRLYRP
ncbi:MAG: TetR/AcrR family transcriptional regulator [Sphaerochaeta sp.]|jgi:AcrR family transcriptional regulator|nr:TetR/AcrR family transcriptional regulator [Spirochaetales bacterium]